MQTLPVALAAGTRNSFEHAEMPFPDMHCACCAGCAPSGFVYRLVAAGINDRGPAQRESAEAFRNGMRKTR
jgi:hypothetical protein